MQPDSLLFSIHYFPLSASGYQATDAIPPHLQEQHFTSMSSLSLHPSHFPPLDVQSFSLDKRGTAHASWVLNWYGLVHEI